jgi:integrase
MPFKCTFRGQFTLLLIVFISVSSFHEGLTERIKLNLPFFRFSISLGIPEASIFTGIRKSLLRIKKTKIENLRWHDATRHTFATRLVQAGVDLYTVQKLGRWKTVQMVMRYAHHYPESLRPGVEILDKARKEFSTNLAQSNEEGVNQNG